MRVFLPATGRFVVAARAWSAWSASTRYSGGVSPTVTHRGQYGDQSIRHVNRNVVARGFSDTENDTERGRFHEQDERFMNEAIEQAKAAYAEGEVPVGAVLVSPDGLVLSRARNKTEANGDPTSHAELLCIRHAAGLNGGWRLLDCTLYVTLEPCPMCAGAILQSRVGKVVYGARNTLLGADGSWIRMFDRDRPHPFHPSIQVVRGVREEACARLMKDFFRDRRRQVEPKEAKEIDGASVSPNQNTDGYS